MIQERDFLAITCLNSRVTKVRDDIGLILGQSKTTELSKTEFALPEQPYRPLCQAVVLWEPLGRKNSTLLMANIRDGWHTLVNILGVKYQHELYSLRISNPKSEWPVWSLSYFFEGQKKRTIQTLKDDPRWTFYEKGEILPFENSEYYQRRMIKQRFNSDILIEYMKSVGWDLLDEKYWLPRTVSYSIKYT